MTSYEAMIEEAARKSRMPTAPLPSEVRVLEPEELAAMLAITEASTDEHVAVTRTSLLCVFKTLAALQEQLASMYTSTKEGPD